MRKILLKRTIVLNVIIFLFMMLFLYAAISKLTDVEAFHAQLSQSPLISKYAEVLAWCVPMIEIIVAITLGVDKLRVWALYGCYFLMFLFTAYIAFMLIFIPHVPCSCGGILSGMSWTTHLVFNGIFTLLAVIAIVFEDFLHNEMSLTN